VVPSAGPTAGGTDITVLGTNFSGTPTVTLGGVAVVGVRVLGTTTIQGVTGAHAEGIVDIAVTVGTSSATKAAGFTYVAPNAPTVTSLSPASGPTTGGTTVTITGAGFSPATTVTFAGVAATSVTYLDENRLRVLTPAHLAGAVDVRVATGPVSGTLAGGFTYVAVTNTLPVVSAITVRGTHLNEPTDFADLGEEVNVVATVADAETPLDNLAYTWTATEGTMSGTGRAVTWKAPFTATLPRKVTLTLRVTESLGGTLTQSVTAMATVSVHDSGRESGQLAERFLTDFSEQSLAPAIIVRDFWAGDVCRAGREAELQEVIDNQADYKILSYKIGPVSSWSLAFGGTCPLNEPGDGCLAVPCDWRDIRLKDGEVATATGICLLSAVYRQSRWWLCSSRYRNLSGGHSFLPGAAPFIR
jgi:hypothetical protein